MELLVVEVHHYKIVIGRLRVASRLAREVWTFQDMPSKIGMYAFRR